MENIMLKFLYYQNQIKIYHWQTKSYSRHKASDDLYNTLINKVDEFMEVIQGSEDTRIKLSKVKMIPCQNISDNGSIKLLNSFRDWLNNIEFKESDTDLMSIRDDILVSVNKTLYLFSLK